MVASQWENAHRLDIRYRWNFCLPIRPYTACLSGTTSLLPPADARLSTPRFGARPSHWHVKVTPARHVPRRRRDSASGFDNPAHPWRCAKPVPTNLSCRIQIPATASTGCKASMTVAFWLRAMASTRKCGFAPPPAPCPMASRLDSMPICPAGSGQPDCCIPCAHVSIEPCARRLSTYGQVPILCLLRRCRGTWTQVCSSTVKIAGMRDNLRLAFEHLHRAGCGRSAQDGSLPA